MESSAEPRVGLLYDERMCRHTTPDGDDHPECPDRIRAIWSLLRSSSVVHRCVVVEAKEAKEEHVALVHTRKHIDVVKEIGAPDYDCRRRAKVAAGFNSIYLNDGSCDSAFLAAGSVVEVSERVAKQELSSAIAIVRPPGHHAEPDEAMGFCIFNNVAVAASFLLDEKPELGIKKILIVDWDVHHGNGTQKMFWNDPRVLYFSVHRHDSGTFYPCGDDGSHTKIGEGLGAGYNINVPWKHGKCGDADYLAVWDHILIPVTEAYDPDLILVSGGFDAAIGDPLGGCCITPNGYFNMMRKLMRFAHGKIVMALEGGYNLKSTAKSVLACTEALLGDEHNICPANEQPFESTIRVILQVREELIPYWPVLAVELPYDELSSMKKANLVKLALSSDTEEEDTKGTITLPQTLVENVEEVDTEENVTVPFSKLSVGEPEQESPSSNHSLCMRNGSISSNQSLAFDRLPNDATTWRSSLSKIYIWYASFGSNMWTPRFLCYIRGGQVEGMNRPCLGSNDRNLPRGTIWKIVPHRLFFGRSSTRTWGAGGVAFLHPEANSNDKAYVCLHKITLEQFNDVLLQENATLQGSTSAIFDCSDLKFVAEIKSKPLSVLKGGWYSNVVYLGEMDGFPALTMTCTLSDIEGFKTGKIPMCPPSANYINTLVRGLVEGNQLSEEEAISYIKSAKLETEI